MRLGSTKDKRKYQCQECQACQYVHWTELNRAARLRCTACGSVRMEPHSRGAKEDRHLGDLNVREHDEARGSVIRSK